jgi:transcriptional regulator with XRE-family HTH domain
MAITGDQVRMGRAALKWTAQELAAKAAISKNTVAAVESGADAHAATLAAIERALIDGGVEFIAENGGGPGVRLAKRRGRTRR